VKLEAPRRGGNRRSGPPRRFRHLAVERAAVPRHLRLGPWTPRAAQRHPPRTKR